MLQDKIQLFDDKCTIWFYSHQSFSKSFVLNFLHTFKDYRSIFCGKDVAIYTDDPIETALLLCFLDGYAKSILFLPIDQNTKTLNHFIRLCGCDVLFQSKSLDDFDIDSNVTRHHISLASLTICESSCDDSSETKAVESTWVIPTSGTTGTPKLVSHTFKSLTRTSSSDREKGRYFTWGLLYGLTRMAGLQVFLQCLSSCSSLILLNGRESIDDVISLLADSGCNALSATPTMWRKILMTSRFRELNLKQITLGGESVDQRILNSLSSAFKESRITHIYASTEAGVGFAVSDGLEGFPCDYLNNPPTNIEISVDEQGFLLLNPLNSSQRYIGSQEDLRREDGLINTGDLVELKGERYIFLGRANGTINIGGNKVQPEEVENIIRSFDGVELVSVYSKSSPIMGALVSADVVISDQVDDVTSFRKQLKEHCKAHLDSFKVPALIKVVEEIRVNHTGKILRS